MGINFRALYVDPNYAGLRLNIVSFLGNHKKIGSSTVELEASKTLWTSGRHREA
jgi:hypothetical protein